MVTKARGVVEKRPGFKNQEQQVETISLLGVLSSLLGQKWIRDIIVTH